MQKPKSQTENRTILIRIRVHVRAVQPGRNRRVRALLRMSHRSARSGRRVRRPAAAKRRRQPEAEASARHAHVSSHFGGGKPTDPPAKYPKLESVQLMERCDAFIALFI